MINVYIYIYIYIYMYRYVYVVTFLITANIFEYLWTSAHHALPIPPSALPTSTQSASPFRPAWLDIVICFANSRACDLACQTNPFTIFLGDHWFTLHPNIAKLLRAREWNTHGAKAQAMLDEHLRSHGDPRTMAV